MPGPDDSIKLISDDVISVAGPPSDTNSTVTEPTTTTKQIRGKPSACVFVASLCASMNDDDLCLAVTNHFQKWGELSTVKVLRDTSNRPYAFVQYTSDESCKLAIAEGQNSTLNGRKLRCEPAKVNRTLFITSPTSLTESELKSTLSPFGNIEMVQNADKGGVVANDSEVTSSNNWYAKFTYRDDAIRAFAAMTEQDNYTVAWARNIDDKVSETKPKHSGRFYGFDKFSIFVGQLQPDISEKDLLDRFKLHGEIKDFSIVRKPSQTYAFITYKHESSAAGAVERENHTLLNNKTIHVQYREVHRGFKNADEGNGPVGFMQAPPPINLGKKNNVLKPRNPLQNHNGITNNGKKFRQPNRRHHSTLYDYNKNHEAGGWQQVGGRKQGTMMGNRKSYNIFNEIDDDMKSSPQPYYYYVPSPSYNRSTSSFYDMHPYYENSFYDKENEDH